MQHGLYIVYMLGARGSLMYFEIENTEDMKNFGEYLKFQSLKLHSAYLNFFLKMNTGTET